MILSLKGKLFLRMSSRLVSTSSLKHPPSFTSFNTVLIVLVSVFGKVKILMMDHLFCLKLLISFSVRLMGVAYWFWHCYLLTNLCLSLFLCLHGVLQQHRSQCDLEGEGRTTDSCGPSLMLNNIGVSWRIIQFMLIATMYMLPDVCYS